jgi:hypothetical protein
VALPFAFCALPFDLFFPMQTGASQNAKRKVQNAKVKPQKRLSWIIAVFAGALPFAFCDLPVDLFLHLESTHFHPRPRHDVGNPREE